MAIAIACQLGLLDVLSDRGFWKIGEPLSLCVVVGA